VGTWIDGSDVYEKTIDFPSTTQWGWNTGCSLSSYLDSSVNKIISCDGYGDDGSCYPLIVLTESGSWVGYSYAQTQVYIDTITIRYTKATTQTRSLSRGGEELTKGAEEPIEEKETEEVIEK
jgi:hypothetical protein